MDKIMTCEEYIENNDDYFTTMIDEMYWDGGCNVERMHDVMLWKAKQDGVTLSNENDFDYDAYFYNMYKNTEKGLS